MDTVEADFIKQREIVFAKLHPDPKQAETAAQLLNDVEGVLEAYATTPILLNIRYHVLLISLEQIDAALVETGFHLSSKLICKLRRALYYYTEETQRANNGCLQGNSNCTRKIFIDRYSRRDHHCQDARPEHWRKYL